ncbi:hypothetical protein M409DRAFT_31151 [Zasmidium cellare ATCC 36951]|uniref:Uncharacterized protein n=1 Tax=Zasmidium cellare ATCC 36951 TaxID=1080233 RepID=A0A6A6BXQ6_ZASCE|nr:uncharacterized protein M409DRAFT_31151 [Zasmidium cellare ATCC 36951]KAF2158319.1 hypothetical protein M409DRAFT_31151 [Zasmidium cellare ATCC 36951]
MDLDFDDPAFDEHGPGGSADRQSPTEISMENRVGFLVDRAKAAGFSTFDDMIEAYYTTGASSQPQHGTDQASRSRRRRLSDLLPSFFSAARGWSDWERRGLHLELLRGAEQTLMEEVKAFRESMSCADESSTHRHAEDMMQQAQEKMPKLWSLIMSLTAKNPSIAATDRTNAVYRTVVALCES